MELTLCPHINSWAIVSPSKDGCSSGDDVPALGGETAVVTGCMGSDGRNSTIGWLLLMVQGGLQEKSGKAQGFKISAGASLVAQWLRICLPMQGTRVRALVWEDPTCRGATGPVSHNY